MSGNDVLIIAAIAVVAVITVAGIFMLTGPDWDDSLDDWVFEQDIHEGDYIEYMDRFTVDSIDGDRFTVHKNNDIDAIEMDKKEFLSLLAVENQLEYYFGEHDFFMKMDRMEDLNDNLKAFKGKLYTDKFGSIEEYDVHLYIGHHNILKFWDLENVVHCFLNTNLPFVS